MTQAFDHDLHNIAREHESAVVIERLTHHIARVREQQQALLEEQRVMREAITRMSEAVTRLALVEERQASTSQAIERVMETVEKIELRVRSLEIAEPMQAKASEWVMGAVWALCAAAAMFVAAKAGLF